MRDMTIHGAPEVARKYRGKHLADKIDLLAKTQREVDDAIELYGYAVRACRKAGVSDDKSVVQWCGSYECDGPHRINDTLVCPGGTL